MQTPQYKRILLKISGEALAGDKHFGNAWIWAFRWALSSAAEISGAV